MNGTNTYSAADAAVERTEVERSERVATPEQRMRRGKRLVLAGFVVAIVGMVGYCVACLAGGADARVGTALLERPEWLIVPTLGTIALGTLLWLVGSFVFLMAAMDSDSDEEINF